MDQNLPCYSRDTGLIPGGRIKILHALEKLSPEAISTKSECSGAQGTQLESLCAPVKDLA